MIKNLLFTIALIGILLAVPGINLYHHIELPTLNKYRITSSVIFKVTFPFISHKYDVRLEDQIYNQVFYEDIETMLINTNENDTVVFHLAGYGGQVDTTIQLINTIKQSKAWIIMDVEAPVYSGHAYLALSGNELIMHKYTFLMLHFSSILDLDCSIQIGSDRGVSNQEHCQNLKNANIFIATNLVNDLPVLSVDEKVQLYTGHDVYLQENEVNKRLRNK